MIDSNGWFWFIQTGLNNAVIPNPDPDRPPWGPSWYTPEWAALNGLPLVCERCHLPFDRTGGSRHTPDAVNALLTHPIVNTHCPRFIGREELWDCKGKRL